MKSITHCKAVLLSTVISFIAPVSLFTQVSRGECFFYETFRTMSLQEREALTAEHILAGNVPDYMKGFIQIKTVQKDAQGCKHRLTLWVKPHYLTVLSGGIPFIVPLTPMTAHKIANALDCTLPTPKIVDIIYEHAQATPEPFNYIPRGERNLDPDLFFDHSQVIFAQLKAAGTKPSTLVAGTKKDVVITRIPPLPERTHHVIIYGWHKPDGTPIQPVYDGHINTYVDYSHGIRLIKNKVLVDGKEYTLSELLADPVLWPLISY
ncbi:MAG TPA: hypothetical protein P5167_06715 [Bacteroidales bacterium]|mgnify:CR=1 FL=1|nr:hypothetical protein [Bacteroidales bacterium]HRW95519.1 hypothetical protein [Bacteroidales bacterium]